MYNYKFLLAICLLLMYNLYIKSGEERNEALQDHVCPVGGAADVP